MLEPLEIFFGDANNAVARVYARLQTSGLPEGCSLSGQVVGPTCEYSGTLAAKVPFVVKRSMGSDAATLVAEAIVPDPCFWSQDLPFLYQAEIELRRGGELLAAESRTFGIRPLGANKRRMIWEGRPWVLRAADAHELPERPLQHWRDADLAMLVENPTEELCREASRYGAVLVADLTEVLDELKDELRRLSHWPAVAMGVLENGQLSDATNRGVARNLLLAQRVANGSNVPIAPWADLVISASDPEGVATISSNLVVPLIVEHAAGWCDELSDARRQCDVLQRHLAGLGDFAGYLV